MKVIIIYLYFVLVHSLFYILPHYHFVVHILSTIIQNSCNSDKGYMVVLSNVMNELSAQNKFFLAKSEMYDLDLHQSIFL